MTVELQASKIKESSRCGQLKYSGVQGSRRNYEPFAKQFMTNLY